MLRRVRITARSPLEYVVVMSYLEGCPYSTYSPYRAEQVDQNKDNNVRMLSVTVRNPHRPQLDETIYVSEPVLNRVARAFRYS